MRLKIGQGAVGWAAETGQGVILPQAADEARFANEIALLYGPEYRSAACAPVRWQGEVIGVLEAVKRGRKVFDQDTLSVLTGIGSLAGAAIRNSQLFERSNQAQQHYRQLFEDNIEPILITDGNGIIEEANCQAEQMTGYRGEDLRGISTAGLGVIPGDHRIPEFEERSACETISYESVLRSQDGREVPVQVYVREIRIEGEPKRQWILRDLTERKNLDNLQKDLIATIYHDLRSPLGNVISCLNVLDSFVEGDAGLKNLMDIAFRSTRRVERLVNSLLDAIRLEAGQGVGKRQLTSLESLVSEALEDVQYTADCKNIALERDIASDLPQVYVEPDMIRRVFVNLLENALKYSPSKCRVFVGARRVGEDVEAWVQDSGLGIPDADHERIFQKYTRGIGSGSQPGHGLGLAFCRLAVQAHGGKIWVESPPDAGARFVFRLPGANNP
jgi:PAS domain S-box-containing protein